MNRSRAWTLVEILVVVAILAVLAAIVYVLMSPAREKGRQTGCISNLRQIGQAIAMYRTDYEGGRGGAPQGGSASYPNVWARLGVPPEPYDLVTAGYVTDPRIFWCPLDPRVKELRNTPIPPGMTILDAKVFSYNWCPLGCFRRQDLAQRLAECETDYRLYREKGDRMVVALDMNHWRYYYFDGPIVVTDPNDERIETMKQKMIAFFLRLDGSVQRLNFSNMPPRSEGGTCGM